MGCSFNCVIVPAEIQKASELKKFYESHRNKQKLKHKVWKILLTRYCDLMKESRPKSWGLLLSERGCVLFPWCDYREDSDRHFFVRDVAMGNIMVPNEVAMRILVLGELP